MFQRAGLAATVVVIALAGAIASAPAQYAPPPFQAPPEAANGQVPSYDPQPGYAQPSAPYSQAPQPYEPASAGGQYGAVQGGGQIETHALPPPPGASAGSYSYNNPPPSSGPYGNQPPPATYGNPPPPSATYSNPPPGYVPVDPGYQPRQPDYASQQPGYVPQQPAPVRQQPAAVQPQQQPQHGFLPNPFDIFRPPAPIGPQQQPQQQQASRAATIAALPPEDQPETGPVKELPPKFRRTLVDYRTKEPAGTIIIDTPNTYLYLVLGHGKAMRYGIGVGREGFTWSGTERISRMAEWPDWHPPAEMIERQPYLPRFMAGGEGNPLGARALYLGKTLYRIHGTNQPSTIGKFVSSGCIRLTNEDIMDLYSRVQVGNRVVVLPGGKPPATASAAPPAQATSMPSRPYNPIAQTR
jgi:lipoprotein-anchoring transpeptidase ErfK/SrfK